MGKAKRVAVFGSSLPGPGDPAYEQAQKLGGLLAQAGWVVLNGGYSGTMEAVSRGAFEAGGHVIGVTCDEIESWQVRQANPWLSETWHTATLEKRLFKLINNCDAALALPGGIGTLAEIVITWSHIQTKVLPQKPLVLIGPGWNQTFETLFQQQGASILPVYREILTFAGDINTGVKMVREALAPGPDPKP